MSIQDLNRRILSVFEGGTLPTMAYINKQSHDRDTVRRPLHKHDSICEILLIYEGEGLYYAGDQVYPLEEGSIIYYNQGDLHEVVSTGSREIGSCCMGLTNLHKKGLPRNFLIQPGTSCVWRIGDRYTVLRKICEQIYDLQEGNEESRIAAQFMSISFLVMACRTEDFTEVKPLKGEEMQKGLKIRDYLDQHFTEDLNLEKVGKALGYSATYVSHVFRDAMGITPIQYLTDRRIGLAQTLLISTDLTVTQIATMAGYDNTNYFSSLFSKVVGMPPTKYRVFYKEEARGEIRQE